MAEVEGLNLRGSRWYVRIIVPDDLRRAYGKARVNIALGTSDCREATVLATLKRAEWLADFEARRSELKPSAVDVVRPESAALLAERIRAFVLTDDGRMRSDLPLLAEMVHVRRELALREASHAALAAARSLRPTAIHAGSILAMVSISSPYMNRPWS